MVVEPKTITAGPQVEIEALLAPIPGDSPVGDSLRYEGTYDAIQEARREDDPTLPQGVWKTELKKAEWQEVESLCVEALTRRTKDLQIGAWLTEAWLKRYGLFGLEKGLTLLAGLCRSYWPQLYPQLEENDLDARLSPIEWMNDKTSVAVRSIRITQAGGADGKGFQWIEWAQGLAHEVDRPSSGEETRDGDTVPPTSLREEVLAQVSLTPTTFYQDLQAQIAASNEALAGLHKTLFEECRNDTPSLREFEDTLEEMTHFVGRILKERHVMDPKPTSTPTEVTPEGNADVEVSPAADTEVFESGPITSRAQAYQYLSLAADYLLKTEPHSPAPYLVRRAIKWGRSSLGDLLNDLLSNNADLATVYSLLGISDIDSHKD